MLGAAIVALTSRRELTPPAKAMSAAQGVIGVVAVEPLTKLTGSDLVHFAGCAAFSVSVTLGLERRASGWRWRGWPRTWARRPPTCR